jgi:hypothetical protein
MYTCSKWQYYNSRKKIFVAVYDPLPDKKCGQNSQKLPQMPSTPDFERFSFFHSLIVLRIPFFHFVFCINAIFEPFALNGRTDKLSNYRSNNY